MIVIAGAYEIAERWNYKSLTVSSRNRLHAPLCEPFRNPKPSTLNRDLQTKFEPSGGSACPARPRFRVHWWQGLLSQCSITLTYTQRFKKKNMINDAGIRFRATVRLSVS